MPERRIHVVAVPDKANYLLHIAADDGSPSWATRSVVTLCGWVGFARPEKPGAVVKREKGESIRRRPCDRCEKKGGHAQ